MPTSVNCGTLPSCRRPATAPWWAMCRSLLCPLWMSLSRWAPGGLRGSSGPARQRAAFAHPVPQRPGVLATHGLCSRPTPRLGPRAQASLTCAGHSAWEAPSGFQPPAPNVHVSPAPTCVACCAVLSCAVLCCAAQSLARSPTRPLDHSPALYLAFATVVEQAMAVAGGFTQVLQVPAHLHVYLQCTCRPAQFKCTQLRLHPGV